MDRKIGTEKDPSLPRPYAMLSKAKIRELELDSALLIAVCVFLFRQKKSS